MIKISTGPELFAQLSSAIATANSVKLAVAFWGAGAMDDLKLASHPNAKIVCNLATGGTNPWEIEHLMKSGVHVRMHNQLHAKIGCIGNILSFCGSSNMSANGLGFEGQEVTGWEEVNVVFDGEHSDIFKKFETFWDDADEISKSDLKAAQAKWSARRTLTCNKEQTDVDELISLWAAIEEQSDILRSLPCYVAYYHEMEEDEAADFNDTLSSAKVEFGQSIDAYSDWPNLPEGYLIGTCRSKKSGQQLKDIDYSRRPANAQAFKMNDTELLIVEKLKNLPHFRPLAGDDLSNFKKLVVAYVDGKKKPFKSRIISIQKLMDFYKGQEN